MRAKFLRELDSGMKLSVGVCFLGPGICVEIFRSDGVLILSTINRRYFSMKQIAISYCQSFRGITGLQLHEVKSSKPPSEWKSLIV